MSWAGRVAIRSGSEEGFGRWISRHLNRKLLWGLFEGHSLFSVATAVFFICIHQSREGHSAVELSKERAGAEWTAPGETGQRL